MLIQLILLLALWLPPLPVQLADLGIEPIAQVDIPFVWCYNMAYGTANGQRVALMAQRRMSCSNTDFTPRQPALWWRATPEVSGTIAEATGNDWNDATLLLLYTLNSDNENNVHSLWFWPNEANGYFYYDELLDAGIRGTAHPVLSWQMVATEWWLFATIDYAGAARLYKLVNQHWQWRAPYNTKLPMILR
jgi:hypothetical protein